MRQECFNVNNVYPRSQYRVDSHENNYIFRFARFTSSLELHIESNGAFTPYRSTCHVCDHHLRHCGPRALLRCDAQDLLQQRNK